MKIAKISYRPEDRAVDFLWSDKVTTTFEVDKLSPEMQLSSMLLGVSTKEQNSYAGAKSKGMGTAECRTAAETMWASLLVGEWNLEARGFGGIWVEAIARVRKWEIEDAKIAYDKLSDEAKAKVRAHPDVKKAKLAIEKERLDAQDSDDVEDLDDLFEV